MTPRSDLALVALALVPLGVGAAAATLSRAAARRLAPATATVLLTALALSVALVTGLLLCLVGIVGLAQVPLLSGLGHWSPEAMRARLPIHPAAGLLGGLIATVLLASAIRRIVRVARELRRTSAAVAGVPAQEGLVVIADPSPFAYAVPGRHQRIVVSTGILQRLSAPQRRVLLAHEAAHLRHRHHLYVQLGRLAAAANPFMRPVSRVIDLSVERWADEVASRAVGDRRTAAQALAAAALPPAPVAAPAGALAATQTDVVDRVASLLQPPRRRRAFAVAATVLVLGCWIAGLMVIGHLHGLMELAEAGG